MGPQRSPEIIVSIGRGEKIRTSDPLHPMQVRYQAAPRPDRMRMIAEIWIERFAAPLAARDATL
jgi:hypothetical protein